MVEATDYIGRVRARAETAAEQRGHRAAEPATPDRFIVVVTRDGTTAEELLFDRPPTLADIVCRVGTDAYILAVAMTAPPLRIAAE